MFKSARIRNIAWYSADKLMKAGTNLVIMLLLAAYGPEQFGLFNYALMMGTMLYTITAVGNESLAITYITRDSRSVKNVLAWALKYRTAVFFISVLVYTALVYSSNTQTTETALMLICLALPALSEVVEAYYQFELCISWAVIPRSVAISLGFSAKLFVVLHQYPIAYLALAYTGEALLIAILAVTIYWVRVKPGINSSTVATYTWKQFAKASHPLLLATISTVLYMRVDVLVLEKMSTAQELGYFTFANRIGEALYFLPLGISSSFMAGFVQAISAHERSPNHERFVRKYLAIMVGVGIACSFIILAAGMAAIHFYFGASFYSSRAVLAWYAGCVPMVAIGLVMNQYLVIVHREKVVLYRYIIGFLANLALNLLLVPAWGALGAAIATLTAYSFVNIILPFCSPSSRPLFLVALGLRKLPPIIPPQATTNTDKN